MSPDVAIIVALIGVMSGAAGSLVKGWLLRPKTAAETKQVSAAGEVALSAEARAWVGEFRAAALEAEREAAETKLEARAAQERAEAAEHKAQEVEALLVKAYGYARGLHRTIRDLGGTPPPPPPELETLWRESQ